MSQNKNQKNHQDNKCDSCGKSFSTQRNLKNHFYTIHEGHKDYKCEDCGKSFSGAQYLKKHIHTVHEGHKDFFGPDFLKGLFRLCVEFL